MDENIREILNREFPNDLIKQRPGLGGMVLDYVEGAEYIRRLNEAFAGDWEWTIDESLCVGEDIVVRGTLFAGGLRKQAYGGTQITRNRNTGNPVCLADDYKTAATDALKKASSLFGIGLHLYSGNGEAKRGGGETIISNETMSSRGSGSGSGSGGTGKILTDRQKNAILAISSSKGISAQEMSRSSYGRNIDELTISEASDLISRLQNDRR